MSAGDIVFWFADHIDLWRPFAIGPLALVALGCVWWAVTAWERMR